MIDICTKGGNEGNGVSLKVGNTWEKTKEVSFYVFFLRDPILLSLVVDNGVLVWMTVNGKGARRSLEKVRIEVG